MAGVRSGGSAAPPCVIVVAMIMAMAAHVDARCHETSDAKCYVDTEAPRVLSGYEEDGTPDTGMTREYCAQVTFVFRV